MIRRIDMLGYLALVLLVSVASGENWPQFRGPSGDGVITGRPIPLGWDAQTNVRWRLPNPGEGWSSPVVWGNQLFLTAAVLQQPPQGEGAEAGRPEPYTGGGGRQRSDLTGAVYRWELHCLNASTGELLWKRVVRVGNPPIPRHSSNTYATETPVTDGERVYAYFGMTGLACYDMQGNPIWDKDLGTFPMRAGWGTSSSPALFDGKLFLQVDNEQQSFLVALDAATGDEIWRVERDERSQYSSPLVWKNTLRTELVAGGQVYRSYDPATGDLLWQLDMAKGRSSATPVAVGDRLYVGTEFRNRGGEDDGGGFLFAVRAGASGDITPAADQATSEGVIWRVERSGIQMASPVVCGGYIYLLERGSGIVACIRAEDGQLAFRQRIPRRAPSGHPPGPTRTRSSAWTTREPRTSCRRGPSSRSSRRTRSRSSSGRRPRWPTGHCTCAGLTTCIASPQNLRFDTRSRVASNCRLANRGRRPLQDSRAHRCWNVKLPLAISMAHRPGYVSSCWRDSAPRPRSRISAATASASRRARFARTWD